MVTVVGALASEPSSEAFADHVVTMLGRYTTEVVATHRLCPRLHDDVDAALGEIVIVLERGFRVALAASAIRATRGRVVHAVFPLVSRATSFGFERFCNQIATRLRDDPRSFVHAAFHPAMAGGPESAFRMVGLLRRSPDPFMQLVPEGMHSSGTTMAGSPPATLAHADPLFARLTRTGALDQIVAQLAALHEERNQRYAPFAVFGGYRP